MSLPRYPRYKDSGVERLGKVPEHWELPPLYLRYAVDLGKMLDTKTLTGKHSVSYLRNVDVQWDSINVDNLPLIDIPPEEHDRFSLRVGDLLVCEGGEVGRSAIWKGQLDSCSFQKALHRLRPLSRREHPRFFFYCLRFAADLSLFIADGNPNTIDHLTGEKLRRYRFPVPPSQEQLQIAEFLDRETIKIDALVAEQQRLMELLKEKRQAFISHAVTKGLNPHSPMKQSGVDWLGVVPAHWDVKPIKHVITLRSGGTPSKATLEFWDGDVPWASSKDLKTELLGDTEDHITQKAVADGAAALVRAGSILVVVRGMILAHTFPVAKTLCPMAINQDLKALEPSRCLTTDFLAWLLRGSSNETLRRTDEAGHGTKVLRLEAWTSMPLPIPPIAEQDAIVDAICSGLNQIDLLAAEARRAIDLLQERRTALISAAVTGQIDVRGLANSEAA